MTATTQLFVYLVREEKAEIQDVMAASAYGTNAGHDAISRMALGALQTKKEDGPAKEDLGL